MEDFVWVFQRPDSLKVAQIPAAPNPNKEEKIWWQLMLSLLQIYTAL